MSRTMSPSVTPAVDFVRSVGGLSRRRCSGDVSVSSLPLVGTLVVSQVFLFGTKEAVVLSEEVSNRVIVLCRV